MFSIHALLSWLKGKSGKNKNNSKKLGHEARMEWIVSAKTL